MATLSFDEAGSESTYFVLPRKFGIFARSKFSGIPPILHVLSKITDNSCEFLTVSFSKHSGANNKFSELYI